MICTNCGFEQLAGDACSQCHTPFPKEPSPEHKPAFEEPPPLPPSPPKRPPKHRPRALHDLDLTIPGMDTLEARPVMPDEGQKVRLSDIESSGADGFALTTTPHVEGKRISDYLGVVSTSVLVKPELIQELAQGSKEVVGIHESPVQKGFTQAHTLAFKDLQAQAAVLGANGVVGISITLTYVPKGLLFYFSGTAVALE